MNRSHPTVRSTQVSKEYLDIIKNKAKDKLKQAAKAKAERDEALGVESSSEPRQKMGQWMQSPVADCVCAAAAVCSMLLSPRVALFHPMSHHAVSCVLPQKLCLPIVRMRGT